MICCFCSSVTVSVTCVGHAWPDGWISACISLSDCAWHSTHACISVCTIDGGKEGTSVCVENKWESERSQPERQDLWNSSYCLSLCTVWIMSNSKQSEGRASVPRWFCTWKDASLTRSGTCFFCALSDSTFLLPELVIRIKKLSIFQCKKNILLHLWKTGCCVCLKFTVRNTVTIFVVLQDACIFYNL